MNVEGWLERARAEFAKDRAFYHGFIYGLLFGLTIWLVRYA